MKTVQITLLQENLNQALQDTKKAVPTKPQLPILSSLLCEVKQGKLHIAATDMFFGIKTTVRGTDAEDGVVAVPGKPFQELIASLKPGKVTLKLEESQLVITTAQTKTQIQVVAADEFPPFPEPGKEKILMPVKLLSLLANQVSFAVSKDETRPTLTGLYFETDLQKESTHCVATDGFRLSIVPLKADIFAVKEPFLVPAKALLEIERLAQKHGAEEIGFTLSRELKQLFCQVETVEIFVRLLEGEYPPYQKIIPSQTLTHVSVDREELLHHLKTLRVFAREASHIVSFEVLPADIPEPSLRIKATSSSLGSQEAVLPVFDQKGEAMTIAFNLQYLIEYLQNSTATSITLKSADPLQPALFQQSEKEQPLKDALYVVMPFKLHG